jgi:hypothetical protein
VPRRRAHAADDLLAIRRPYHGYRWIHPWHDPWLAYAPYIRILATRSEAVHYCVWLYCALIRPGRHQKILFSKILEVISRPEFAHDHESGLRSDRGPVVLCDFSKLRFWKSPCDFLNLYGRFCPYNPPYKPGEKISTPPFFSKMRTFPKNRLAWFHIELWYNWNHASRLLKNILIFF